MISRRPADESSPIDAFTAAPPPEELRVSEVSTEPKRTKSLKNVWQQTLQSKSAVLGTLFLVTGALGLPLLWYSPVFTRFEKLLWSLIAIAYTSALIGVTGAILYWCYQLVIKMF